MLSVFLKAQSQEQTALLSRQNSDTSSDSGDSEVEFSICSLETQWALLIASLIEILSNHKEALKRMKSALVQRVISRSVRKSDQKIKRKFNPVIGSREYKEAKTVEDFFCVLGHYWGWKEYSLLEFVLRASGCRAAIEKLEEFIASRQQAAPHVVLQLSHAVEITPEEAISSNPLLVEESCPGNSQQRTLIVMKVDGDELTLRDYDQDTTLLCRVVKISRHDLALLDTGTGSIIIRWVITSDLAKVVQRMMLTNELLKELAERRIVRISIGSDFHLNVASIDYWELPGVSVLLHCNLQYITCSA